MGLRRLDCSQGVISRIKDRHFFLGSLILVIATGLFSGMASAKLSTSYGKDLSSASEATVAEDADAWQTVAPDVRYVVEWIAKTSDNEAMPYIIIDKVHAKIYVFDEFGKLQSTSAALLGMVQGDKSSLTLGSRELSDINPSERTTPAGRFIASMGRDIHGQDILWVDYSTSLALHRVVKGTPTERRAQRLESATPQDNRISYGCINVPVTFYERFVKPAFTKSSGVVYILPEMSLVREMFKVGDFKFSDDNSKTDRDI